MRGRGSRETSGVRTREPARRHATPKPKSSPGRHHARVHRRPQDLTRRHHTQVHPRPQDLTRVTSCPGPPPTPRPHQATSHPGPPPTPRPHQATSRPGPPLTPRPHQATSRPGPPPTPSPHQGDITPGLTSGHLGSGVGVRLDLLRLHQELAVLPQPRISPKTSLGSYLPLYVLSSLALCCPRSGAALQCPSAAGPVERVGQDEITPLFSLKEGNTRQIGGRYAGAQTAAWVLDRKACVGTLHRAAPQLGAGGSGQPAVFPGVGTRWG